MPCISVPDFSSACTIFRSSLLKYQRSQESSELTSFHSSSSCLFSTFSSKYCYHSCGKALRHCAKRNIPLYPQACTATPPTMGAKACQYLYPDSTCSLQRLFFPLVHYLSFSLATQAALCQDPMLSVSPHTQNNCAAIACHASQQQKANAITPRLSGIAMRLRSANCPPNIRATKQCHCA